MRTEAPAVEGVVTASKMLVSQSKIRSKPSRSPKYVCAAQTHALALGMLNSPIAIIDYPSLGAYMTV